MVEYRILPGITDSGEPMWTLYQDWELPPFAGGSKLLAKNADRDVLVRAIEHLSQGKGANDGP